MINSELINFGILGIWTMTLLVERSVFLVKTQKLVENNTLALHDSTRIIGKLTKKLKL